MATPLEYARRGLKQPRPIDHRSPLERKLDRIFLIIALALLGMFWGAVVLLFALVYWSTGA